LQAAGWQATDPVAAAAAEWGAAIATAATAALAGTHAGVAGAVDNTYDLVSARHSLQHAIAAADMLRYPLNLSRSMLNDMVHRNYLEFYPTQWPKGNSMYWSMFTTGHAKLGNTTAADFYLNKYGQVCVRAVLHLERDAGLGLA
jgi:hypothetical protein